VGQTALVDPGRLTSQPVVAVRDFCKKYRRQVAVEGVSLSIQPGEIYGLIGPDGAGKSSLMKAIAGVLTFDRGEVDVLGVRIDSEAAAERVKGRIGFMPQGLGLNLYAELSVEEIIDFFAALREVPAQLLAARKRKLLAMTRLEEFVERPVKQLSGGMKQKLGLVCTLIHEPELVILDEPTTGVDPVSRRDFWAILAELLRDSNITALVSTAYMDEASRFHRLSLIFAGQVLAEGVPEQIRQRVSGSLIEVKAASQIDVLGKLKAQWPQTEAVGEVIRVFVDDAPAEQAVSRVQDALTDFDVDAVNHGETELEDAFVALLRERHLADDSAGASDTESIPTLNVLQTGSEVAIEAVGLTRQFGDFRAVDEVSFKVMSGEIFGLLGANGAGKTTVIKMLTGILPPSGGRGQVAGADMRSASQAIKERIGYMSQAFSLYQDMTVLENLRLYARIYAVPGNEIKQRIAWVISMAGLEAVTTRLAGKLSMGVRQRLALGCALVHRPRVLFLDEPTSGVDPVGRRRFWDILVRMARLEQVAILVTTHNMAEAEHCDHLALMYAGQVIADATPAQMKQRLQNEAGQLLEVVTDQPMAALQVVEQAGFEGAALFGQRVHLLAQAPEQAREQIVSLLAQRQISLLTINPRSPSLEDVFVYQIMAREKESRKG